MNIQSFDYSINLLSVILWQYNEANNLQQLIQNDQNFYDENHVQFWTSWYTNVFNLQTANDFGLFVWSIILNIPIQSTSINPVTQDIFGFGQFKNNFNNGNFYNDGSSSGFSTEERRLILKLRYYHLVANGAIPNTNKFLNFAFQGFGNCYIVDNLDMTVSCFFDFPITYKLLNFIKQYDLIPRCTGVRMKFFSTLQNIFGFGEFRKNFNNGNFIGEI
jgi:hypothetical protein